MTNTVSFTIGFILGISIIILIAYIYSVITIARFKKKYRSLEQDLNSIFSKFKESLIIQERLNKVKNITEKQLELFAKADGPQKNALDGKYKNSLIAEINELEEEKNNILLSILNDNMDPTIVILDEQGRTVTVKLSEYMGMSPVKHRPKLTVYQGGKSTINSANNTHNSLTAKDKTDGDSN